MFKLGYMNIAFVLFAPTILARLSYNEDVNNRVDNLWRIHRNREDHRKVRRTPKNSVRRTVSLAPF